MLSLKVYLINLLINLRLNYFKSFNCLIKLELMLCVTLLLLCVCLINLPDIATDITKWASFGIRHHPASLPTILDILPMYLTGDIYYNLSQVGGRDV
jgi:hypothetical protein